jgi:phage-related protein
MIVAMQEKATEEQIDAVIDRHGGIGASTYTAPPEPKPFWPAWDLPPVST